MTADDLRVRCGSHVGDAHPPRCQACEELCVERVELERLRLEEPDPTCSIATPCARCVRERELTA